MAGLIDVGILKPELAGSFAAGYRGAEQARQESQQKQQQFEMNQMKLEQLKQDRAALTDLQAKLRARGQSDDPTFFFRSLIETGNPDYVAKGYEGLRRYSELQRADALLRREAPELFGPSSTAPTGAAPAARNALAPVVPEGDLVAAPIAPQTGVMREVAPGGAVGPETPLSYLKRQFGTPGTPASANALAPTVAAAPAAPATNVLAPAAAAAAPEATTPADANARIRELRNKILTYRAVNDPRLKSLADVYEAELKELTKPQVLSPGQQMLSGGRVVYTAPPTKSANVIGVAKGTETPVYFDPRTDEQFTLAVDPSGKQIRKPYTGGVNRATSTVTATATSQLPPQEKAFESELGKGQAERILKSQAGARDAVGIIDTVNTGRQIMQSGMITGAGAEFLVNLNQALKTVGIDAGYADASANSQAFAANMAGNVGRIIKQFGAGTGLSNADREYAEKMAGGKITLDASAIRRILDINERAARNVIKLHNKDVSGIKTNIPLTVEEPPATRAAASTTAPPPAAVEYLRVNPAMRGAFDAKYGAGAADRALKGQ